MPCYHPLKAFRDASGVRVLSSDAAIFNLRLPCGQCVGCRLERSRQWALRCLHEASLHASNSYITLTYAPEHVPSDGSLNHRHFQLFMKRLRKYSGLPVRYYMCGEYGESRLRPHFHALLFGIDFPDRTVWRSSPSGSVLYRSAILERLWPFGHSSVGDVTFQSAAYVARYVMKKVTGDAASKAYEVVSIETGEVISRMPEYNRMSLKPGIGAGWFDKYSSDVFPHDRVIHDGTKSKPPRYYDKLLSRLDPDLHSSIKNKRMLDAQENWRDNVPNRLVAKEAVVKAKISFLKRGILNEES